MSTESIRRSIAFCREEAERYRAADNPAMGELWDFRAGQHEKELAEVEAIIRRVRERERAEQAMKEAAE